MLMMSDAFFSILSGEVCAQGKLPRSASKGDPSGRAGRDGLPAKSILYYSAEDRDLKLFLMNSSEQKKVKKYGDKAHKTHKGSFEKVRCSSVCD